MQSAPRTQGGLKTESESFQENTPNHVHLAKTERCSFLGVESPGCLTKAGCLTSRSFAKTGIPLHFPSDSHLSDALSVQQGWNPKSLEKRARCRAPGVRSKRPDFVFVVLGRLLTPNPKPFNPPFPPLPPFLPRPFSSGASRSRSRGRRGSITLKARLRHAPLCLRVLHESLPNEAGAYVFGHQHGDAGIDADDILVIPLGQRIERIHEAIAAPGLRVTARMFFSTRMVAAG